MRCAIRECFLTLLETRCFLTLWRKLVLQKLTGALQLREEKIIKIDVRGIF